ncbi:late secretory pathway protein AVL9 homolog isoform X1 [Varroa jacobsoni]|uniref:UDENN domain-containing protein n=1 Tax=Varroa destructor TaxID=109461 RepID=A0A7M7KJP7_VARDE|nr:late secretory pathway protein AVL9 homolog isoform X1 [Varroa destructor]XP_022694568.1 late secretory pathway protein AVL9 homolog isoform X1 [Varroa jacobsoni]
MSCLPYRNYNVMDEEQLIYLAVVGFHHSKGYQIEFCYPEIRDVDNTWMSSYLAPLGLPDGAHNFAADTVYFRFRDAENRPVWGVCSYRQVDSASYKDADPEVTRSAIQKSVCLVGRGALPPWRTAAARLEPIAHAFIQHQDSEVLHGVYDSLKTVSGSTLYRSLQATLCDPPAIKNEGGECIANGRRRVMIADVPDELLLELRSVLEKYDTRMLTLLKLRLLGKKVLFMSSDLPTQLMCSEILALEAAVPGRSMCLPYITLSMMEDPVVAQCTGFVGASNRLYKQKWRDQFEALVENSNLLFADKSLERLVSPTQADLRFIDWLQKTCRQSRCHWEGSEEWLRSQLEDYFRGMRLAVEASGVEGDKLKTAYGVGFVQEVSKLDEVVRWLSSYGENTELSENGDNISCGGVTAASGRNEQSGHPGAGQPSLQDVKLRLVHHAKGLMAHFNNF